MLQEASVISSATELVTYHSSSLSEFFEPDLHDPEPGDCHICSMTYCTVDQGDN